MKVHHLNCGTMHMPGADLVCHVLLVETNTGLALVDGGFGIQDCADPARLAELQMRREPDLLIVCAHDPALYRVALDTA